MITTLKLDKRLRDKQLRSGELSKDELTSHINELPDLVDQVRYRKTEAELAEERDAAAEESASDEQQQG